MGVWEPSRYLALRGGRVEAQNGRVGAQPVPGPPGWACRSPKWACGSPKRVADPAGNRQLARCFPLCRPRAPGPAGTPRRPPADRARRPGWTPRRTRPWGPPSAAQRARGRLPVRHPRPMPRRRRPARSDAAGGGAGSGGHQPPGTSPPPSRR